MVHMFQVRVEDKQRGVAVLVLALMLFKNVLHHGQHLWHPVIVCVLPHREGEEWGREPPVTTAQTSLKQESSVIHRYPPPKEPCVVSGVGQQLDTYPGQVRGVSYPVHHLLTLWMDGCYVGPHPLPGDALNGETSTVDVEQNSSVLLILLPWGAGAVIQGWGIVLGAAAEEAVGAGALGPAMSAQFGRGAASAAGGGGSSHRYQREV